METGGAALLPGVCQPHGHVPLPGGRPQKSFSLPELQCFISDSQLTRDAALHLRPGDRAPRALRQGLLAGRSSLGRRRALGGPQLHRPPPARDGCHCPLVGSVLSLAFEPSGTKPHPSSSFLLTKELHEANAPHPPFKAYNEVGFNITRLYNRRHDPF